MDSLRVAMVEEGSGVRFNPDLLRTNALNIFLVLGLLIYYGRGFLGKVLRERHPKNKHKYIPHRTHQQNHRYQPHQTHCPPGFRLATELIDKIEPTNTQQKRQTRIK